MNEPTPHRIDPSDLQDQLSQGGEPLDIHGYGSLRDQLLAQQSQDPNDLITMATSQATLQERQQATEAEQRKQESIKAAETQLRDFEEWFIANGIDMRRVLKDNSGNPAELEVDYDPTTKQAKIVSTTGEPLTIRLNNRNLTTLPEISLFDLEDLDCSYNQLTTLPELPDNLEDLRCYNNQLTTLPELPASLQTLYCNDNQLTTLPELPASLQTLYCYNNQLTTLPELPASLQALICSNNQLTPLAIANVKSRGFNV